MRILVVGANMSAMKHDVLNGLVPTQILTVLHSTNRIELIDGSEIHLKQIACSRDCEKLRGARYDWVIEHSSFPRDSYIYSIVRAIVLR